jgi:acetyl esterase
VRTLAVGYRLAPEHPYPAAHADAMTAWRYLRAQGLAAGHIAVGGDSAGGNLAAVVALQARDAGGPAIAFQLLVYPATDQRCGFASHRANGAGYLLTSEGIQFFRSCYLPERRDWEDWRASPLLAKSVAALPPALVLTAGFDPLIDEGRAYAERLAREGVEVSYRQFDDMVHGFLLFGGVLETANAAVAECSAALRRAFEKVPA